MSFKSKFHRIEQSSLFKDSFWAVFGNGVGYGLLLLAGILIARFLGKDVYGEYGMVKTTMFYIASFSTFGLGYTCTKFIAQYKVENPARLRNILRSSLFITLCSSLTLATLLIAFAPLLASYLDEPRLVMPFRLLGGIIVVKALSTTQQGLLAGFGEFKTLAINNVWAGIIMTAICVPFTYFWGLRGALSSLAFSQLSNVLINFIAIHRLKKSLPQSDGIPYVRKLLLFSFPVALQELSYTVSNWGGSLLLVKYASLGEMGIYSATAQWNTIVMIIPSLLSNVVLSHLSGTLTDKAKHKHTISRMLAVNLCCTLVPFLIVSLLADWISSFYGSTFNGMASVLRVFTFATIFSCCSEVFRSEMIAQAKTWILLTIRFIRDITLLIGIYMVLSTHDGNNAALYYASVAVGTSLLYFLMLGAYYKLKLSR